jgi:hypothetical protein
MLPLPRNTWMLCFPKPTVPRKAKKKSRFFMLATATDIIAAAGIEHRPFYRHAAETVLRSGELAGRGAKLIRRASVSLTFLIC